MKVEAKINLKEEILRPTLHGDVRTYKLNQEQLTSFLGMSADKKEEFLKTIKSKRS